MRSYRPGRLDFAPLSPEPFPDRPGNLGGGTLHPGNTCFVIDHLKQDPGEGSVKARGSRRHPTRSTSSGYDRDSRRIRCVSRAPYAVAICDLVTVEAKR